PLRPVDRRRAGAGPVEAQADAAGIQSQAFPRQHDGVLVQSIRPFLERLEQDGELLRIPRPVDPAFELSAFLSAADAGPALLFETVNGSSLTVAGNLLNSRAR